MNRHFILFIVLLFATTAAKAQSFSANHELSIGYGIASISNIPDIELPINSAIGSRYSTINEKLSGTFNASYMIHLSTPFAIGLFYSYGTVERDVVLGSSIPLAKIKNELHSFMLTAKYSWLNRGALSLYSRAGVGLTSIKKGDIDIYENNTYLNMSQTKNDKSFSWQAMPLGIEWRFIKHLALFAEGGVATCGCGLIGLRVLL